MTLESWRAADLPSSSKCSNNVLPKTLPHLKTTQSTVFMSLPLTVKPVQTPNVIYQYTEQQSSTGSEIWTSLGAVLKDG